MTHQMTPAQKTLVQAIILAIVLGAPLLFAQSNTGKELIPATPESPQTNRISTASLDKIKSSISSSFTHSHTGQISQRAENAPAGIIQNNPIYQDSIILQHGDTHTILPRHSVIYLPESHKNKITTQPKGDFVTWPAFYINNRNWLFTHQINLNQAAGLSPIKPEIMVQFKKINRVVVAIYQHGPISALPRKSH